MTEKGGNFVYERTYEGQKEGSHVLALPALWQRRVLEGVPGLCSWMVLLAPFWLTLVNPTAMAVFTAGVVVLFIWRAGRYGFWALANRRLLIEGMDTDWLGRLDQFPGWQDHRVIFLIRAYREGNRDMLAATLSAIYASRWPRETGLLRGVEVVFATESKDPITPALVEGFAVEFQGRLPVRQIVHPPEPNILPGPSSAMHYVGRVLHREAVQRGEDTRRILVADLDADTLVHPNYLPSLLYHYLSDPRRDRHVYQPAVFFTLDYWRAPLHSRLAAISTSGLTLGWNREPEIAFTGAAANLALLKSVDFWPTQSHSQDSGIDLKLRMQYGREYRVVGLPVPLKVYPVMVVGETTGWSNRVRAYLQSFRVLFRQSARWREGPLDEFVEASQRGRLYLSLQRLWAGVERDTLTFLPGAGYLLAKTLTYSIYPGHSLASIDLLMTIGLSAMSLLGLAVYWHLLSLPRFMEPTGSAGRRLLELILFWVVFSVYVPLLTAGAGLRTSTAYLLGNRPTGHYTPTPK